MRALRRRAVPLTVVAALVAAADSAIATETGPRSHGAFLGFWQGIDPLDGSSVRASITDVDRDGVLEFVYRESFFTLCFDLGSDFSQGRGLITGEGTIISPRSLEVATVFTCIDDNNLAQPLDPLDEPETYTLGPRGVLIVPNDPGPDIVLHRLAR